MMAKTASPDALAFLPQLAGSTRGIGYAIAEDLAALGVTVSAVSCFFTLEGRQPYVALQLHLTCCR